MNAIVSRLFPGSRSGAKIGDESDAAALASRRRLVHEIETLQQRAEPRLQELLAAHVSARAHREQSEAAFKAAQTAELEAHAELRNLDNSLSLGVARLERELERTASARIDEAIAEYRLMLDRHRASVQRNPPLPAHLRSTAEGVAAAAESVASRKRIEDRSRAINCAVMSAMALKLEALTAEDIEQRLAAISASIPSPF